ncbi:putative ankyrin repeat protein RBE_0220 [Mytilus edulis]|uniref:putative ankyrin repeat protein RBE_0220 n=1 Tax=Mytilus edulis TaxID=6550 RepID=UPI0039EEADDC
MITETKASKDIYSGLEETNCVFLVGRPGSGKSSILRHIALRLVKENDDEDFDIIPDVVAPSNVIQWYNEKRNQIFILDDFCGKDKVNNQIIDVWKFDIEKILKIINKKKDCFENGIKKVKTTKIMISCNISVYESHIFEPLKRHLDTFSCKLYKLSEIPLDTEEREEMIRKYVPTATVKDFKLENEFDFPLLCKLSKGKPIKEIQRLFSDPLKTIKEDLTNVQTKKSHQFCAIALCTLFNNEFKTQWLNQDSETEDIRITDAVSEMFLEFNLDLTNDTDRMLIHKQFEKEQPEWLSKSGDTYHHIHDEIFKIASVICGESYERCFINHAPSSFIAKRYSVCEKNAGLITFNIKYQKLYFDRLFRDLENGSSYSTFQNIQLKCESYRKTFIKYCKTRNLKFKELLDNIKSDKTDKKSLPRQNTIDFDLKVPLIDCASQGYEHMVGLLLEMGCDVNVIDHYGRTALFVASEQGYLEIVKKLVDNKPHGANITFTDNNKKTSLHMACEGGHTDIVKYLIEEGADISALDLNGCSSLHMACISGKKEIVEYLLKINKEEIHQSDNFGQTPIIIASLHGEKEVVEFLLQFDKEERVQDTDKKGFTPLLAACMNGHINTTTLLIDKRSDILHSDNNGRTALFIACEKGQKNIVELLIEKGKNQKKDIIDKLDWHMNAPIYIACAEKRTEIVKILIDNGAKINNCNEDKKSPLYVACEKGNLTIVELLLKKEADMINICDRHKKLPLHVACKRGDLKMVKLLYARHEASPSNFKQLRETAKNIAVKQGHDDIAKFLTDHDVDTNNKKVQGNIISD